MRRNVAAPPPPPIQPEIKGQITARRGIEVGLAGNHRIVLYGPHGSGRHFLQTAFPDANITVLDTCPCGHALGVRNECRCTPDARRLHWQVAAYPVLREAELAIEVADLPLKYWEAPGMTPDDWEELDQRVNAARLRLAAKPTAWELADDAARRTRELVVHKLGLSCQHYMALMSVSRSIAALGDSKVIQARHVAEAAQYIYPCCRAWFE